MGYTRPVDFLPMIQILKIEESCQEEIMAVL